MRKPVENVGSLATISSPVADLPNKLSDLTTSSLSQEIYLPHQVLATYTSFKKAKEEISAPNPHLSTFRDSQMTNPVNSVKAKAIKPKTAISPTEIAEIPLNPPIRKILSEQTNPYNYTWILKLSQTSVLLNGWWITKSIKSMKNGSEEMENDLPFSRDYFVKRKFLEPRK